ncbi:hypothetical protein A7U58_17510 [Burkholderia pseudomallei]|nr:hypothetical protein A7U58_17510 [Burkholderia pseudomallei]ANW57711.1 hypothetical protein A7U59_17470 [Burkholderia pseudomallei]
MAQLIVEVRNELDHFVAIRPNNRMHNFAQESQEAIRRTTGKVEPIVRIHPVEIPVIIVHAVLPDISRSILEAAVVGRKLLQIV